MKIIGKINAFIEHIEYKFIRKVMHSTLVIGIIAHGFMLFNKFTWNDDTVNIFGAGATNELGRWSLEIVRRWEYYLYGGSLSMSLFNGLGTFVCIAIASFIIMKLTNLDSDKNVLLISGIMVTSPTILGFFSYMNTALFYGIGLVFTSVGVYLFYKKKNVLNFILAAALIAFGTGIYQAWFGYCLAFIVFLLLVKYLNGESDWKKYWIDCISNLSMCIVALTMYLSINKFYLVKYGIQMIDHANMNTMGIVPLGEYIKRIGLAYKLFFRPTRAFYPSFISKTYKGMLLLLVIALFIYIFSQKKSKKQRIQVSILIFLFPVAVCSIIVMAGEGYSLMFYPYIFPYILLIWLLHNIEKKAQVVILFKNISILVIAFMIFWFIRYNNASYQKALMVQNRANTYFMNLIGRIQNTEGYSNDLPIAYLDPTGTSMDIVEITPELMEYSTPDTYINYYSWEAYLRLYCGFNQEYLRDNEIESFISNHDEVKDMQIYPNDNSVKVVDGVVVVKFSEKYDD